MCVRPAAFIVPLSLLLAAPDGLAQVGPQRYDAERPPQASEPARPRLLDLSVQPPDEAPRAWRGGAVPAGWRRERRASTGLVVAGSVVFAVSYAPALALGVGYGREAAWDALPVLGALGTGVGWMAQSNGDLVGLTRMLGALTFVDGLVQGVGLALAVAGALDGHELIVPDRRRAARWSVSPGTLASPVGASVTVTTL